MYKDQRFHFPELFGKQLFKALPPMPELRVTRLVLETEHGHAEAFCRRAFLREGKSNSERKAKGRKDASHILPPEEQNGGPDLLVK